MRDSILVNNKAYWKLCTLGKEECGFIYGRGKLDKVFVARNVATDENEYKMSKWSIFVFFLSMVLTGFTKEFYSFHVHTNSERPSRKDIQGMIPYIIYLIVYDKKLFFYIKDDKNAVTIVKHYVGENNG